jgi:NitT/TauT family transport system permease protein
MADRTLDNNHHQEIHIPQKGSLLKHRSIFVLITILVTLGIWEAAILIWRFPAFILPGPLDVWNRFLKALGNGSLLRNSSYTLLEILCGLFIGSCMAMLLGYLLAKSPTAEHLLSPYLVASQAIPLVAVAPLLIIWFGPGIFSKILICSLIVFFPVLVNTIVGLRAVPANLQDLMSSLYATKTQVLRYLEIPAALPVFLGGLRIGATLSVIGAIVGEFVGSDRGLGFLINVSRGQYDTALVFVAIFTLVIMALALYGLVLLAEKQLLKWRKE